MCVHYKKTIKGKIVVKKILSVLLASTFAVGMLAGCGGEKKDAAKSDVIKIGVFEPLTGDNAAGGELELRGIKLANKLHPEVLGKKVELVIADNKSDKAEAASVASTCASSSPCLDSIKASAILEVINFTARIASSFDGIT